MATYEYDNAGNNIRKTDALNKTEQYAYDYAGRIVKTIRTDAGQNRTVRVEYDTLGNKRFSWDEAGEKTEFQYDGAGRLIQITAPFDGRSQIVKYFYDAAGNVTWEKKSQDSGWQETQYIYDVRNRLTDTCQYLSQSNWIRNKTQYNVMDRIIWTRTGDTPSGDGQQITKYTYDRFGNVVTMTDARGCKESCQYDKVGRLQEKTDRNGNRTAYQYDALERLKKETVQSKTAHGTMTSEREYAYGKTGRASWEASRETEDGKQTVFLETRYYYDKKDQLSRQEDPGNVVKEYSYDLCGNRQSFRLTRKGQAAPDINLYYTYDDLHRLKQVRRDSAAGVIMAEYEYDVKGNRKTLRYPQAGMETSYTYNKANRVMSLENKRQGSVISAWKYGYDRDGNMVSKTNQTSSNPVTISYRYDRLGRLTEEDYSGWKRSFYEYDACSNRTKMMVEGKTKDELVSVTSYEYGLNNRLEKEVRKEGKVMETWKYRYDDTGNETFRIWEKTSPTPEYPGSVKLSGSWKREAPTVYEWRHYNGFHQLIRANQEDKEIAYQYRGDGLRHSSEVRELTESQSKTKVCYWDGTDIVGEQTDGGSVKRYLRGINLLAGEAEGMVYYYILNEHGDVAQLWGQSGTRKALYEYDAFGNERNPEKGDENPFRYCGEYYDLSSGTYYLRNRYYNPINGRFLTEDPIRDGLNWYTYCANNPIMFIDPLGLALLQQYVEDNKGTVTWDDKTKTVTATVNGITRSFTEGTYGIFINRNGRMDVPDDILEVAFTKASKIIDCTKDYLVSSSSKFGANSQTVASVIFTEQHYNVDWKDYTLDIYAGFIGIDTSNGTGQVKISTAKFLEDKGYMDRTKGTVFSSRNEKILIKLWDDEINVNYTTAYLKYFQDTWQAAYPNISNDPAILGSLYNLGHSKTPHANPQSNWFGDYVQQHYNAMSYLLGL